MSAIAPVQSGSATHQVAPVASRQAEEAAETPIKERAERGAEVGKGRAVDAMA